MKRTSRRDESLEHLLKESLQAPWQTPPCGSCPDAEVLAAWTDGVLEGRELAMTREHVAGCVSCQATLAVLARTAPPEATSLPWWQRMPSVRWLVPVAATATAIAIWVAVPREEYTRPAQETTGARESAAPPPESPQSAAEPKVAVAEESANRVPQIGSRRTTTTSSELRLDTAEKAATGDVSERQDAASPARERAAVAPREQTADTTAGAPARREPVTPPAPAGDARAGALARQEAAPATATATQPAAPTPAASRPTPAARPPQFGRFGTLQEAVAVSSQAIVASPDTAFRWRIGPAGSAEYSADTGETWEARPTGVNVDLVAGSSPAGTVCWIVGRAGIVLQTTNGIDFRRLTSPTMLDLTAVQATDTRTAIVTAANGRRFRTTDGGVSWQGL